MAAEPLHPETGGGPRRPLVGLALAAAAGAALGLACPLSIWLWLAGAGVGLAAGAWLSRGGLGSLAIHLGALCVFALAGQLQQPAARPQSLARLIPAVPVHIELVGVVADEPAAGTDAQGLPQWRMRLAVEGLRVRGDWQTASDFVTLVWAEADPGAQPALGDRWRARGLLRAPPAGARSRTLSVRAVGGDAAPVATGVAYPIRRWCERGRAWCGDVLGRGLEDFPREAGLLRALILGYRQELPPELFQAFSRTGTLHVIAVSGSHVAIFAGIVVALIKMFGLPRTRWVWVVAPALLLYCMSTGLAPSAIRACIMALVFWSATLFDRRPDGPSALGVSALLILAASPGQIQDAGFILSFVAVAGLMIFYPPLRDALARPQPVDPLTELPPARWLVWLRAGSRATWHLLAASIAAWLVTTPLTMTYFHLFSPSGLLLNLAVIPLAAVVLFAGTLSLLAAPFSDLLVEVVNHAARLVVAGMVALVNGVDGWPGSHFYVASPPAWVLVGWGAALLALFFGGARARRWTMVLLAAAGAWSVRAALVDRSVSGVIWARDETLAGLVDLPGSSEVLLDTGRSYRGLELVQRLRAEGVDRLTAVVVTRARSDAAGGVAAVLREIPVDALWCAEGDTRSSVFREVLAVAAERSIPVRRLRAGESGEWPGGVEWTVLGAEAGHLDLRVARGPAALRWTGSGAGGRGDQPVTAWICADGATPAATAARVIRPDPDPLAIAPPNTRLLADGAALRWAMADDRTWRAPAPAWTAE